MGLNTRFSDGSYGVYYAALDLDTAIAETVFYREKFMACTHEPPIDLTMRVYAADLDAELHDLRGQYVGVFRQKTLSNCRQAKHLAYAWDGSRIAHVVELTLLY